MGALTLGGTRGGCSSARASEHAASVKGCVSVLLIYEVCCNFLTLRSLLTHVLHVVAIHKTSGGHQQLCFFWTAVLVAPTKATSKAVCYFNYV
jgi:hypothetical protein